jgi:hypothetical protein
MVVLRDLGIIEMSLSSQQRRKTRTIRIRHQKGKNDTENARVILVGKSEWKRPLVNQKNKWEDNVRIQA